MPQAWRRAAALWRGDIGADAGGEPAGAACDGCCGAVELPPAALTASLQAGESLAAFCCRQASAAEPPVGTLAQYDW